jgi:hypothetical protein
MLDPEGLVMSVKELEQRVIVLEREVQRLSAELASAKTEWGKDWRRAVDKYKGDEDLLAVFAEAQKLREQDRKRARKRYAGKRKSKL